MPIPKIFLAASALAVALAHAPAAEVESIPQVGKHYPILTVEKNVNPQNSMVVWTKVDATGRFVLDPTDHDRPIVDFYWLMDGKNYKAVNALIKSEIRRRLELQFLPEEGARRLVINVNDLKEVNSDIKDPRMDVIANGSGDACEVEAQMNLGPSDGNMRIKLTSIYTEGRAFPPAVYSVTLKGEEIVNGKPTGKRVVRKYEGKK